LLVECSAGCGRRAVPKDAEPPCIVVSFHFLASATPRGAFGLFYNISLIVFSGS